MKCAYCGQDNPPGTRLCTNCKFVLREVDPAAFDRSHPSGHSHGRPSKGERSLAADTWQGRKRKPILVVVSIGIVAIIALVILALNAPYTSDPSMSALLFYRYLPPTEDSDGSVRVSGDVYNFGFDDVDALLRIFISDDNGHSSSYDARIGVVRASGSVDVSETFPWPHPCLSSDDLTVEYAVLTRNAGLF